MIFLKGQSNMTLSSRLRHVMILTGEPSGDFHASRLVSEARQFDSRLVFSGIGGTHLEKQGVDLFYDISKLSAMGVTEVLMQAGQIKKAFDRFKEKLKADSPEVLILVDYPGFNLKAAQFAKSHLTIKVLYYITPKVWAWKKSRIKKIKKYIDFAALILPFEEKIFKKSGIPCTYVGNPLVDEYPVHVSKPFLRKNALPANRKKTVTIGLLPGSRKAEINNLLDIMIQSAIRIHQGKNQVRFFISQADSIKKEYIAAHLKTVENRHLFQINGGPVRDILLESDLVIAASGTVTLEAALCCVPTILIYKMSPVSYYLAKLFVKLKYVGLANLIVNREVMPELLQADANPEKISQTALYMMDHLMYFQDQLQSVRKRLGSTGAARKAAKIAINMLASPH